MKAISKKQFENAVKHVLNGGNSKFIETKKVCPFYWSRSKGYCNLHGSIPANSKYIGNIGRGGKESEQYLVCYLAKGFEIAETKKEAETRLKAEIKKAEAKKQSEKAKREQKKASEIATAESFGLSVKEYRKKISELNQINENLYNEFLAKRELVISEFGFQLFKIVDRVKLARVLSERGICFSPKNLSEIL
jgi:hypothetical protein